VNHDPIEPNDIERLLADDGDPMPPELEARMRVHLERLHARLDAAPAPPEQTQGSWIMSLLRNLKTGRARWATAGALATVVIVLAFVFYPSGLSQNSYAAVVEQLRAARAVSYRCKVTMAKTPDAPLSEVEIKVAFKEMFCRMEQVMNGEKVIVTVDGLNKRELILTVNKKEYQLIALNDATFIISDLQKIEELRKLPPKPDKTWSEDLNGRRANVYQVDRAGIRKTLWLDVETRALVKYAMEYPKDKSGMKVEVWDFNFDPRLDPGAFSTAPPAGYKEAQPTARLYAPQRGEKVFQDVMRDYAQEMGHFPPLLDPARPKETLDCVGRDFIKHLAGTKKYERLARREDPEWTQKTIDILVGAAFVTEMDPERDFHYAGATLKPGDAADWVAWWKPTGKTNYRVLRGDLTMGDATSQEAAARAPAK
jgi:hypothetical protein